MLIPCQRHLFDIPDEVAYLNCAYMSPLMRRVVAAGQAGIARKTRPWSLTQPDFFTESDRARALFARVLNGDPECVAVVPAVSYGIAVAAANVPVSRGQQILVLEEQFPSNVYAWRELARASGAEIVTVAPGSAPLGERVLEHLGPRTAVAALPHCRWTDGALLDLEAIGARCRELGAALVLDLTQSAGALPVDIERVDPDFAVCACYKWLLGPYMLGFLHVAPRWHQGRALEQNWIARGDSEDFAGLVDYRDDYAPGARRFDVGERASFHLMPMAVAALAQILDWDVANVAETLGERTRELVAHASALGLSALPEEQRPGHYLGLRFPRGVPDGLLAALAARQVYVSLRGDSLRVTPHLYNNAADLERLLDALASAIR
jgi:selenocysteine lyase/cysteine desulfurase